MEKIYCGNKRIPSGYGRYGTRNECLKCGFGAAMMQYKWSPPSRDRKPPRRSRKGCYRPRRRPKEVSPSRSYSRDRRRRRRSPSSKGRKSHRRKINRWIEEEHRQRFGSRKRLSGRGKSRRRREQRRRKSPRRKSKKRRRRKSKRKE